MVTLSPHGACGLMCVVTARVGVAGYGRSEPPSRGVASVLGGRGRRPRAAAGHWLLWVWASGAVPHLRGCRVRKPVWGICGVRRRPLDNFRPLGLQGLIRGGGPVRGNLRGAAVGLLILWALWGAVSPGTLFPLHSLGFLRLPTLAGTLRQVSVLPPEASPGLGPAPEAGAIRRLFVVGLLGCAAGLPPAPLLRHLADEPLAPAAMGPAPQVLPRGQAEASGAPGLRSCVALGGLSPEVAGVSWGPGSPVDLPPPPPRPWAGDPRVSAGRARVFPEQPKLLSSSVRPDQARGQDLYGRQAQGAGFGPVWGWAAPVPGAGGTRGREWGLSSVFCCHPHPGLRGVPGPHPSGA